MADRPLWSLPQRLIHWGLVLGLGLAWWSAEAFETLHEWTGYAVASLIGGRVLLGFGRHPAARWGIFGERLRQLPAYLAARGRLPMPAGHSPVSALSLLILMGLVMATSLTGWMLTLEAYVGDEAAEERHNLAFTLLQGWVVLHLIAGLMRKRLLADMFDGGRSNT